jgi:hypothetical protein
MRLGLGAGTRFGLLLWLAGVLALLSVAPAAAEKRVALVIGNSAYQNVSPLDNPVKDARLIADTLSSVGFTLVGGAAQLDLDKNTMTKMLLDFGHKVQGADVALFYYAGHGVQVKGQNYLVPVEANPTRQADVDFQMIDVNGALDQMEESRLKVVILDACRNNPFGTRSMRATNGVLAQMQAPDGTLIAYATQPGAVAQDGSDGHSPYTRALANALKQPGLSILDTFNTVGVAVKHSTNDQQLPWVSYSPIEGSFYFVPPSATTAAPGQQVAFTAPPNPISADPDHVPLTDPAMVHELAQRLYERNFDTDTDDRSTMTREIIKFEQRASMEPNGEPTEGLLSRLRKMERVGPWGSIVYDPDSDKWGMTWNYPSRRAAVIDARTKCGTSKCPQELSFYGKSCGAFAISDRNYSMIERDTVDKARQAALDECGKAGKSCHIIAAVCANDPHT